MLVSFNLGDFWVFLCRWEIKRHCWQCLLCCTRGPT